MTKIVYNDNQKRCISFLNQSNEKLNNIIKELRNINIPNESLLKTEFNEDKEKFINDKDEINDLKDLLNERINDINQKELDISSKFNNLDEIVIEGIKG